MKLFSPAALLRLFIVLCIPLTSVSCIKVPELKPWVAPYERSTLSREEMVRERHTYPSQFREHVYSVRGAAQGATGSQGGGCGCN